MSAAIAETAFAAASRAALDSIPDGLALFDPQGRQVLANTRLLQLCRAADGIEAGPAGRLLPAEPRARQALDRALLAAAGGIAVEFAAPRPSGRPPYIFRCRPLTGAPGWALAVVVDPSDRPPPDAALLRRAFALTPAEAALAVALGAGESVGAYAVARGISIHTARCHMRALKAKLGLGRQSELVALITAMAA